LASNVVVPALAYTAVERVSDGVLRHMAVRRLAPGATQSAREHAPREPRPREIAAWARSADGPARAVPPARGRS
jgi:hypothetical protein